jgi:hypothetical protein
MKNLTLFLWILTTAMAMFFAYHTYTHTGIRYKDLESVMMQDLAVEKGINITRQNTDKQVYNFIDLIEKQGKSPADLRIINTITSISIATDTTLRLLDSMTVDNKLPAIDYKVRIGDEIINFMTNCGHKIPIAISKKDSSLLELATSIIPFIDNTLHFYPFSQQAILAYKNRFARLETKGVDRILSSMCIITIKFDKVLAMASAKSHVVNSGKVYEAQMFISRGELEVFNHPINCQMQISEGYIRTNFEGDVGEIEIKNVKAQNYNSEGKATKTLTGKIMIMKADGSDTTFTLSTSYTVKKK